MRASETNDREKTADADLVLRSRSGDADAFGELWARHSRAGVVAARSVAPSLDPDDLVQEAFATLFQEIRRGGGPTGSFRAYLFAAIRCTAESREPVDPASAEPVDAALDESLTVTVFRHLPERWQETLWYTEVEGRKPSEIASLIGLDATDAAQLAYRARAGLRDAWIRAHAATVPQGSDCRWTDERLGAHARGNLSGRDRERADAHIASCPRCAVVAAEAQDVGSRLPLVLLPLALGVDGAAGHLTAPPDGGAGLALASMPAAVTEGTSVVAGETPRPRLFGRGAEVFGHLAEPGAALATGAVAAAPRGGRGMLSVAGMVTAGACSLAIAAVIAAAAILPDHFGAGSASASFGDSAAAAEIEPDARLAAHSEEAQEPAVPAPTPDPPKAKSPKTETPLPDDGATRSDDGAESSDSSQEDGAAGVGAPTEHPVTTPPEEPEPTETPTTGPGDPTEKPDEPTFAPLGVTHTDGPAVCGAAVCVTVRITGTAGQMVRVSNSDNDDVTTPTLDAGGNASAVVHLKDVTRTESVDQQAESDQNGGQDGSGEFTSPVTITVAYSSDDADVDPTTIEIPAAAAEKPDNDGEG